MAFLLIPALSGACDSGAGPAEAAAGAPGAKGEAKTEVADPAEPGPAASPPSSAKATSFATATRVEHPGCLLVLDLATDEPFMAGQQPCDEATTPASTFKIPHSLIAMDTGVVTDVDAKVQWDGTKYPHMAAWERDHTLRSAIYESVVWYFMRTAKAIGRDRMREYLKVFEYGNASVEEPIDRFWLEEGSLKITGPQQLRFLAALYRGELPRGQPHLPRLKQMLVRPPESFRGRMLAGVEVPKLGGGAVLSAKTGTGGMGKHRNVTWLVGHVGCPDREYVFVSRVIADGEPSSDSPAATHGLVALDQLGVLRCDGTGA